MFILIAVVVTANSISPFAPMEFSNKKACDAALAAMADSINTSIPALVRVKGVCVPK